MTAIIHGHSESANYILQKFTGILPPKGQSNFKWCKKCEGLYFSEIPSTCPTDFGPHNHTESANYVLQRIDPGDILPPKCQSEWRHCRKCQGLAFSESPSPQACPVDFGPHDHIDSFNYFLKMFDPGDVLPPDSQKGWKWCNKCQGLAFSENPQPGKCIDNRQSKDESMDQVLNRSVQDFKSVFTSSANILKYGQFHLVTQVVFEIARIVEEELGATPDDEVRNAWNAVKEMLFGNADNPAIHARIATFISAIIAAGLSPFFPNTKKALTTNDPQATKQWAENLVLPFWASDTINTFPPTPSATIQKVFAAFDVEKDKCVVADVGIDKKYRKATNLPQIPVNLIIPKHTIGDCRLSQNNDIVKYDSLMRLNKDVIAIKKALHSGFFVLCGVVSGLKQGSVKVIKDEAGNVVKKIPEKPEHTILLFGFRENSFLFWDSDSGRSFIETEIWGPGFGQLYYLGDFFSTAFDQPDLEHVIPVGPTNGDHTAFPRRHRYQVYEIQTL